MHERSATIYTKFLSLHLLFLITTGRNWCGARLGSFPYTKVPDHIAKRSGGFSVEIPVNFHMITNGPVGKISMVIFLDDNHTYINIYMQTCINIILRLHICVV